MTRATSLFLDVLRLSAALVVFAAHTAHYWNPDMLWAMQAWAHDAVVVFFVLSGYVIAYTTEKGERDARGYVVARLSRLYSVVAPALVLTAVLWLAGRGLDPDLYANHERAYPWLRFAASGAFLNSVWMMELSPPANTPFWSLGYEAWYYLFFGLALFIRRSAMKWTVLVLAALLAGPNILMLLPVWLIGAAAYRWREMGKLPRGAAWSGFIVAAVSTFWLLRSLPDWPTKVGDAPWYFAGAAISDLISSLGWAAMIWFFNRASGALQIPNVVYRPVRWLAGHTFSLYLYHAPLVLFVSAVLPPIFVRGLEGAVLAGLLVVIGILGAVTEGLRGGWKKLFSFAWDRVARRL
jgi:Predicted acyltransferases